MHPLLFPMAHSYMKWLSLPEDAASHIVDLAKTIEKESPGSLRGLGALSRLNLGHAEARLHQLIKDWGLTIPVEISFVRRGLLYLPMIRLTSWFRYILQRKPEKLLGGFCLDGPILPKVLTTFWQQFEQEEPNHDVFLAYRTGRIRLDQCIPYWLFGDEGRGHRKAPLQIFAFESAFGVGTIKAWWESKNAKDPKFVDAFQQTAKGSSFDSRFLLAVMPHTMYCKKECKHTWRQALEEISKDAEALFSNGVMIGKNTYYGVPLGLKGDAPALVKAGKLSRSFYNLGSQHGMCPHCRGGQPGFPWEDMSSQAKWIQTIGEEPPWNNNRSPLSSLPCNQLFPEGFYVQDPFHVFKIGIGRHFVASCVILLMEWNYFPGDAQNVPARFARAHDDFVYACRQELKHATPTSNILPGKIFIFPSMVLTHRVAGKEVTPC